MTVYVLKKWKVQDLVGFWQNDGVVETIDEAESYVEHDRKNRDYDEYILDTYNHQIFGERKTKEALKQEAEECVHDILFWLNLSINKENIEKGGSYILKLLEPREKQIEELKKGLSVCNASNSFNKEQLTKAKEIIEKLISQNRKLLVYSDVREEAEQFLKEISE